MSFDRRIFGVAVLSAAVGVFYAVNWAEPQAPGWMWPVVGALLLVGVVLILR